MAVSDIYYLRVNLSTDNRAHGFGFFVEEIDPSSDQLDAQLVADGWNDVKINALSAMLGTDTQIESIHAGRRWPTTSRAGLVVRSLTTGSRSGNATPLTNAMVIRLEQAAADAKHNGRIFIGGLSENDHTLNRWDDTYTNTTVQAFADSLLVDFNAVSPASGKWRTVVMSKALPAPPTTIGTPLVVTSVTPHRIVYTQKRRRTDVYGAAA